MKRLRGFFISSIAVSIFSSISTALPFFSLTSLAAESVTTASGVIGSPSKPASYPSPDFYLKNSLQKLAQNLFLAEGVFKFEGRPPVYYSNGQGAYCWYQTFEDYVRLTGNSGWRTQPGRLANYNATYGGICTGSATSIPAPHPDPDWTK